jgi:preprotein translocase subunit SecE
MTGNDSGKWTSDYMVILLVIIFISFIFGLNYYFKYAR